MTNEDLLDLIAQNDQMMTVLNIISDLNLPDCWLVAGSIRNFVWNSLSGYQCFDNQTDIDVVYSDTERTYEDTLFIQKQLEAIYPFISGKLKIK